MSIAANRHKHIRAVLAYSPEIARISRSHNDANVICFGARTMDIADVLSSLDIFLSEHFLGEKYERRNKKLDTLS
jgi:ribose 5-phosphate isomerase B